MILRLIPNLLTCCNVMVGVLGIINVFQGRPQLTALYILVAAAFDFLDGLSARLFKVQSPMGKELDSLADMVSFSALPALFMFSWLKSFGYEWAPYLALLIAPFSAWRLAKFNIDTEQSDKFIGLPTPANAIFISSWSLISSDIINSEILWGVICIASCYLLVAPLEMLALKFKNLGFRENLTRYLVMVISIAIFAVLGIEGLVFVIPAYILVSLIANFAHHTSV